MSTRNAVRYSKKKTTTTTTARDWNKSLTHMEHRTAAVGQEGFVNLTFQSLVLNISFRVSWFRSSPLLIHVPGPLCYSPTTCSHYTKVWHRTYPICDAPLSRPALRSFAPLQKLRRNHCPYVWAKALFSIRYAVTIAFVVTFISVHNGNMENASTARAIEFNHSLSNRVSFERLWFDPRISECSSYVIIIIIIMNS